MITVLGLVMCVAVLAYAAGAVSGWGGGWRLTSRRLDCPERDI